jgi:hypothetical protein
VAKDSDFFGSNFMSTNRIKIGMRRVSERQPKFLLSCPRDPKMRTFLWTRIQEIRYCNFTNTLLQSRTSVQCSKISNTILILRIGIVLVLGVISWHCHHSRVPCFRCDLVITSTRCSPEGGNNAFVRSEDILECLTNPMSTLCLHLCIVCQRTCELEDYERFRHTYSLC